MKPIIALLLCLPMLAQDKKPEAAKVSSETVPAIGKPNPDGSVQITITLGDLLSAQSSLAKLFNLDLPVKTAWGLRKTVAAVDAELKRFHDQRIELVKKHGNAETGVPPDKMPAFSADYKLLTEIKATLTITQVSLSTLGDGAKLSAGDVSRLEMFLIP